MGTLIACTTLLKTASTARSSSADAIQHARNAVQWPHSLLSHARCE